MAPKQTSVEVAERLGIDRSSLLAYISRHPELRPAERTAGAWFWSEDEIQRLEEFRAGERRRKEA